MAATFIVPAAAQELTAATVRSLIELTCGAGVTAKLIGFDISFDGVTASAVPVVVELTEYATTGTGTAFTILRYDRSNPTTSRLTAKTIMTTEGATQTVLQRWYVPPTSGLSYQWPLGREHGLDVSKSYALRANAPAAVNVIANLIWEE